MGSLLRARGACELKGGSFKYARTLNPFSSFFYLNHESTSFFSYIFATNCPILINNTALERGEIGEHFILEDF